MNANKTVSLFEFLFKIYDHPSSEKESLSKTVENTLNMCKCYPGFPDCDIITNISGQKYEKTECCASMLFIDSKFCDPRNLEFVFKYKNPIDLTSKNLRLIRKLLEAVNTECGLVVVDNKIVGVIQLKKFKDISVPTIKIISHMVWQAYLGECPLFQYKNGEYCAIEKFNEEKFIKSWEDTFKASLQSFSPRKIKKCKNGIIKVINIILKLGCGTSIVILDEKSYSKEVKRLTRDKSGHGIKLSEEFSLFNINDDKIKEILSQIVKIDGGLLISLTGKCCSMGCIFDGIVDNEFKGNIARGSRYNSVNLYVHYRNKLANENVKSESMGIILSDDETIDFVPTSS